MEVTAGWYMSLAALLFIIGAGGMLIRRNALMMFMSIELMLNSVNLTFVAAGKELGSLDGQLAVFFVLVVAAAEVVVGLAIIVSVFQHRSSASADELSDLRG
ncbi:MAG: NADH-quinone oxidoreductase subunit NuoK [Acidimicrobiia bacterium]|jgi:NADH-quinone oxidoreductase subunit K|nr:NADH-quinone oxidoreductase subunit NuoK [Acidimicrobiia bacterium]